MKNPFKRDKSAHEAELKRLFVVIQTLKPDTDEYEKVLKRIEQIDRLLNKTTDFKKTLIPTLATGGAVVGIYALQQFAGVLVPKALETLSSRSNRNNTEETD